MALPPAPAVINTLRCSTPMLLMHIFCYFEQDNLRISYTHIAGVYKLDMRMVNARKEQNKQRTAIYFLHKACQQCKDNTICIRSEANCFPPIPEKNGLAISDLQWSATDRVLN